MGSGYSSFQDKLIQESGLVEETAETILEMKTILADYREWKAKKSLKSK